MDTAAATAFAICVPIVGVGAAPDSGAACGVTAANGGPENFNFEAGSFSSRPFFLSGRLMFLRSRIREVNLLELHLDADHSTASLAIEMQLVFR